MRCLDAHNHLQDDRFAGRQETLIREARAAGVERMVVNGTCEEDWPAVAALAEAHPDLVVPAFGYHPWRAHERTRGWRETLEGWIAGHPGAGVGEIGLDRWILEPAARDRGGRGGKAADGGPAPLAVQEDVFAWQLRLAAERNLPVTIHCLQAWGRLVELLRANPRPEAGFLLHSYGGSAELVDGLVRLGAYFGFPGYFAHERKAAQREVFRRVPLDRLLVETDAPDQMPPEGLATHRLVDADGRRALNHPANCGAIQAYLGNFLGMEPVDFGGRLAANFARLFG